MEGLSQLLCIPPGGWSLDQLEKPGDEASIRPLEHFPVSRVSSGQMPETVSCERSKVISALTAGPGASDPVQPLLVLL